MTFFLSFFGINFIIFVVVILSIVKYALKINGVIVIIESAYFKAPNSFLTYSRDFMPFKRDIRLAKGNHMRYHNT